MTAPKLANSDAITLAEAAAILGMSEPRVSRLRREGLLVRLEGYPSYSRDDVQAFIDDPWLNGRQAALILGVSHNRVSQLASQERIPVHFTASGRRVYRQRQLEVVANARTTGKRSQAVTPHGLRGGREPTGARDLSRVEQETMGSLNGETIRLRSR